VNNKYYLDRKKLKLIKELIELGDDKKTVKKNIKFILNTHYNIEDKKTKKIALKQILNQIYQDNE
jgi:hypothetical protein|tara:strand:+ start:260 stop:454 length:195 start_codon:yes stop_codon:yes gene_type:complete